MLMLLRVILLFLHSGVAMGKDLSKVLDLYAQILMIKPPSTPETKLKTVRARAPSKLTDSATQPNSKSVTNTGGLPELLTRLSKAKNKAKATRKAIRDHWGLAEEHAEHIDAGLAFTAGSSTAQPVARPVPDGPARAVLVGKMLRAIVSDDPAFTVAFAGTSVSAGHDNWFNQSHPFCYERAFGPSFAAAGGALRVRNHAMGGNSVTPSHFCAPAQLDLRGDLDLAVYEFAMIAARDDCRFEYFVRSVLLLPRAPAFMAYTTSGLSWRNDDKGEASTVAAAGAYPGPKLLTKQTCKRKWMVDYYANAGAHYGDLAAIGHELGHLPQFVSSKMMGVRENCGGHPNTCKAIHGGGVPTDASVSLGVEDGDGSGSGDRGGEKKGGGKKGGGGGKKKQADPRRRRLAPFHPGPGAHEWTGQMLAHAHLALLIGAVEIAERAASALSPTSAKEGQEAVAKLSGSLSSHWQPATPLPPPAGCHGPYCLSTSAHCFSTYTPRSPEADLAALMVGASLTVDVNTSDGQRP
mmetsp:Transcript_86230/g.167106  ORF Transcript_86230/g.167106 Transcript_86230/m.167106 type:complete len:522 (+) Transcript_86230:92-1657(+)